MRMSNPSKYWLENDNMRIAPSPRMSFDMQIRAALTIRTGAAEVPSNILRRFDKSIADGIRYY